MMLMGYFGLREDPFGNAPSARFLYQSKVHSEALASLRFAYLKSLAGGVLIAAPGMGKTILLNRFMEKIRESSPSAILIRVDPYCGPREIVFSILDEIGVAPAEHCTLMREQLKNAMVAGVKEGKKFVVVIDEAQNLSDAALEEVSSLIDPERPGSTTMHIVLAGRPQLMEMLKKPALGQFRERIATFSRLEALNPPEISDYIDSRLKVSGYSGPPLFAPLAVTMIAAASRGIPRTINDLCFSALSLCSAMTRRQVDVNIVAEVIANLELPVDLNEDLDVPPEALFERYPQNIQKQEQRLVSGRQRPGQAGENCRTATAACADSRASLLTGTDEAQLLKPGVWREEVEQDRRVNPVSTLRLTVILVGFLSAFVFGAIGCLMALEHFSG